VSQPFSNNPASPPAAGSFAQDPFAPPPKKSSWWMWLLGGCGCSVVLLVLCCGGVSYWGATKGGQFLGKVLQEALQEEIAGNADVEEHLGEINSLTVNFVESGQEKSARGSSENVLVMDAVGTKGNGKFIVESPVTPKEGSKFSKIDLKLPDGTIKNIK